MTKKVNTTITYPEELEVPDKPDIYLRLAKLDDAESLYTAVDADREHLSTYQKWAIDSTLESTRQHVAENMTGQAKDEYLAFRIVEKTNNKIIGGIGFRDRDIEAKSCQAGYWLSKEYEGKGYALASFGEAFNCVFRVWELTKIVLEIAPGNKRSEQLAIRLGAEPTDEYNMGSIPGHPFKHRVWQVQRG